MNDRAESREPSDGIAAVDADRFAALWRRCVATPPSPQPSTVYARLVRELTAPARHFHNLEHVHDCVRLVDDVAPLLVQRDMVELGLWFHDAILDVGAADNELRSAKLFLSFAEGAAPSVRHRVSRLILATRHAASAQYGDRAFIVDIDLAGLAAPWDEFMHKGDLLRREFASQDDDAYYRSQVGFLNSLLKRPRLYATEHFHRTCEAPARANLERLLALRARQGYAAS